MNAERPNAETIFHAARQIDSAHDRDEYLKIACGQDQPLRARIERLLRAEHAMDGFLVEPRRTMMPPIPENSSIDADATLEQGLKSSAFSEEPGDTIGRYRLLEQIGEGGFGVVFMAEQREPIRRKVALKIIKLGMDTRQIVARFEQERQALAIMDHPNIARVYDAGATRSGRPFFVMELCNGDPVTAYCDQNKLSIRDRLELFVQICRAVQHAHQKGIIHRDIKPRNVLVSEQDGRPLVKVIDFGIAKATEAKLTDKTLFTGHRQMIGTPQYMSPEQASGSLDIDTRTDVYSLGVLLYELLTGTTPCDPRSLRSADVVEFQRMICEIEPQKPSTRFERSSEVAALIASQRGSEPRRLGFLLRGDLDWLTMKALEKDRTHRYSAAGDFAADVQRHLDDEPILAGPPRTSYRVRKFIRRHRIGVIAGTTVALALVIGVIGTTWGMLWALEERSRADEAASAEMEINRFLTEDLLGMVAPAEMGRDVKMRDVLDVAAQQIEGRFVRQPFVEASIRITLGRTYSKLGLPGAAIPHFRRAIDLLTEHTSTADVETLQVRIDLAAELLELSEFAEAESVLLSAMDDIKTFQNGDRALAGGAKRILGWLYVKLLRLEEADAILQEAVDDLATAHGPDSKEVAIVLNNQGVLFTRTGRLDEAAENYQRALDISAAQSGPMHPRTLTLKLNLSEVLRRRGEPQKAKALAEEVLEAERQVLGDAHPSTLVAMNNVANLAGTLEQYDQAESLFQEVIERSEESRGAIHADTATARNNLGQLYRTMGRV
ncbi:MAG: tetratricopeptide repeat protein, partial [Phycisphaerae bacterium]